MAGVFAPAFYDVFSEDIDSEDCCKNDQPNRG